MSSILQTIYIKPSYGSIEASVTSLQWNLKYISPKLLFMKSCLLNLQVFYTTYMSKGFNNSSTCFQLFPLKYSCHVAHFEIIYCYFYIKTSVTNCNLTSSLSIYPYVCLSVYLSTPTRSYTHIHIRIKGL